MNNAKKIKKNKKTFGSGANKSGFAEMAIYTIDHSFLTQKCYPKLNKPNIGNPKIKKQVYYNR